MRETINKANARAKLKRVGSAESEGFDRDGSAERVENAVDDVIEEFMRGSRGFARSVKRIKK